LGDRRNVSASRIGGTFIEKKNLEALITAFAGLTICLN
jgi:hypothetical protein